MRKNKKVRTYQFTKRIRQKLLNRYFIHTVKNQLKARYKDVPGRIITMALDSVDYSEEKACKILEIVMQDDKDAVKSEIKQEIKEDACVDNESAPAKEPKNEVVQDGITKEERYLFH